MENRHIHFGRVPPEVRAPFELRATAEIPLSAVWPIVALQATLGKGMTLHSMVASNSRFIADPARIWSFDGNDHIGLQLVDQIVPSGVCVGLSDSRVRIRTIDVDLTKLAGPYSVSSS